MHDDHDGHQQHQHDHDGDRAQGQRGADAVRALVTDSAYSDSMPTTLMLVTHGSWITAAISNLLELDPDGMNALGGMRNACWCRLKVRHSVNGIPAEQPLWELEEYNKAPAIADSADWENGPTDLRGPHMPSWQPIVW